MKSSIVSNLKALAYQYFIIGVNQKDGVWSETFLRLTILNLLYLDNGQELMKNS